MAHLGRVIPESKQPALAHIETAVDVDGLAGGGPMGGQPKSKASSLSSAEVGRLWEEPTEETGPKPGSVGILAL